MANNLKKFNIKTAVIIALCLVIACSSAGVVYAYITSKTDTVSNDFVPAKVSCAVEEQFENGVKSNVAVRNTGNVDSYIRAVVVATFQSPDGKVLAAAPVEGTDYTVTWAKSGWQKGTDGFWYYTEPVAPNAATKNLIETASAITAPDGYELNMQIIATAVQSDPAKAVEEAWGITPINGKLTPN